MEPPLLSRPTLDDPIAYGSIPSTEDDSCEPERDGKASIPNEIANIMKNLIGSGVLSLPGGLALYSNSTSAISPAFVLIGLVGLLLAYFALLIASACEASSARTYKDCWQRTVGQKGATAVAIVNAVSAGTGDLAYATILSQTLQTLVLSFCGIQLSRIACLLIVTMGVLWPLCRMKDLYRLAPFSVLGTAGMVCTALLMIIRCVDGSYKPGGMYYTALRPKYQPSFGQQTQSLIHILPLVSMLFQAFIMHYTCPRFYAELRDASLPRFQTAISASFSLTSILYLIMTAAGYLTFGGSCDSYILNNYAVQDPLASIGRLSVFFSTLLIYPLAFVGCRDGLANVWNIQSDKHTEWLTACLLAVITLVACVVSDLGLINAVTGGVFATAIVVVFPTAMYSAVADGNLWLVRLLCCVGSVLGLLGAFMSLQ